RCLALSVLLLALTSVQGQAPAKQGIMSTFAGTGERGLSGDGGPANKAKLSEPFHCEVDHRGHLYVADAANHAVRKIDLKSGVITTVAGIGKKGYSGDGGPAKDATMAEPYAVAVDAQDNLFIADRLNNVIRKVDGKSGVMSTVAGVAGKKGFNGDDIPGTE